jgi:hypothetical protein
MLNTLDKILLFRSLQVNRSDILKQPRVLHVLIICKQQSQKRGRCNYYTINTALRACRRTLSIQSVFKFVGLLLEAGYLRKSSGKGSRLYITQLGLQTLEDFNRDIEQAYYPRKKIDPSLIKKKAATKKPWSL